MLFTGKTGTLTLIQLRKGAPSCLVKQGYGHWRLRSGGARRLWNHYQVLPFTMGWGGPCATDTRSLPSLIKATSPASHATSLPFPRQPDLWHLVNLPHALLYSAWPQLCREFLVSQVFLKCKVHAVCYEEKEQPREIWLSNIQVLCFRFEIFSSQYSNYNYGTCSESIKH